MSREDILKGRRTMIEKGNFITLANLKEHYIINGNVSPDLVKITFIFPAMFLYNAIMQL